MSKAEVNGIHFDIVCFEEKYWQHLLHQNIIWIYVFETLGDEEHPRVLVKRKNFEVKIRWQMMHYQALIDFSKNEKYMKMFWIKMKKYNKTKKKIVTKLDPANKFFSILFSKTFRFQTPYNTKI